MSSARRTLHATTVLVAAALVASGCGGGGDVPADAGTTTTPTPGATTPGGTVADPGATGTPGATDPATGLPTDPAATASEPTATVPELVGDDVAGGLDPIGDSPVFDAKAVDPNDIVDEEKKDETAAADEEKTTTEAPKVTYTGAKIYVDGIVHSVNRNGTFPKGNPVFRLLSVTPFDVEIALIAGEFTSSGGEGTYLDKGDLVSLVNASEQVTYRVKYLRPITSTSDITF
jgi:hypothetical protein